MNVKLLMVASLVAAAQAYASTVNCDRNPHALAFAIEEAERGEPLTISGTCEGGVTVTRSITLIGRPGAIVSGGGDVIRIVGPAHVAMQGLQIQNGVNGIHGLAGAQLVLKNVVAQNNAQDGILLESNSSATLNGGTTKGNGLNGLDAEANSSVIVEGPYAAQGNAVFGVNINGASSLTLAQASLTVSGNILGIQIGTSAAAFISDPVSSISVQNNFTTGLTIVSGSHMVAFGGTINATGNGVHGISIDSKAGLDLDAAAVVTSSSNGQDGVHLEETSVMTIFNTTAFSGAPGSTTLNVNNNGGNGVSILTGSNLTLVHQALINSTGNKFGIFDDNGSSLTLIGSDIAGNQTKDISVTFGSRADVRTTTVGTFTCDATALVRGDKKRSCPQ